MIAFKDIFRAVCGHISKASGAPVFDSDLQEPVVRPSFKVFMDKIETGFFSSSLREIQANFQVFYFAADRAKNKAEIIDVEDKISASFLNPFLVKPGCGTYVDNLEFESLDDGILECKFSIDIIAEFESDEDRRINLENGMMEELYLDEKLEKEP